MEKNVKEDEKTGALGVENAIRIFDALEISVPEDKDCITYFSEQGYFIGKYTFEVDMMEQTSTEDGKQVFIDTFNLLVESTQKKNNFKRKFEDQDYEFCLRRIEDQSIGKGRFAQIFSGKCIADNCPEYVRKAIEYVYSRVDE